ncbi:MAG: PAS domain-containing sensor histidine kinase [Chitinophagaceae bacterium]
MKTAFLTELFTNNHSLIALFDPAIKTFNRVNEFGLKMLDIESMDELAHHFTSGNILVSPPMDRHNYFDSICASATLHGHFLNEIYYKTGSGDTFWGLLEAEPFVNNEGIFILIKLTDISQIKEGRVRTAPTATQLQALFNNSTIGIVITNGEGTIINFNQFAENQFGYLKDEVIGRPVELLIPNKLRRNHKEYKDSFNQHPQNRVMGEGRDLFALRKDQSEFPVQISLNHYENEGQLHVIAFVIDITVRKASDQMVLRQREELQRKSDEIIQMNIELEKKVEGRTKMLKETLAELEKSREELSNAFTVEKQLSDLKSKFVTMASHEFRTPLTTILSSSYIIEKYKAAEDQDKRARHLEKIKSSVQTLTFILEDFLSLEKLEGGYVHASILPMSQEELVQEIEGIMEELTSMLKNGQEFQFSLESFSLIHTDRKLLKNILLNLLSNAIKYSPEKSYIDIRVFVDQAVLKISVTDRGIGIPDAEQAQLFERFFRASNASTIQGTGLGLHIVTRYLELIGAEIEMVSKLNEGTTFTVSLR